MKAEARAWLFDSAAPLWSDIGVLNDGMFAESIDINGRQMSDSSRRLRVQARQIYSFCTLGQMGWQGPWRKIANRALDVLLDKGIDQGKCVHLFSSDGEVLDRSLDLYNHAFTLFALAHAGNALERPDAFMAARAIQGVVTDWQRLEGGFWEGVLTPCPPFRQNPHMHMFEAAWSHSLVSDEKHWRQTVDDLRALFIAKLRDPRTGAVTEYFDETWKRLPGSTGQVVEPGHCLEWAWLFYEVFDDAEAHAVGDGLTEFARRHGICPTRDVAINEVRLDGAVLDYDARLWPQTERLKAAVGRFKLVPSEDEADQIVRAYRGLSRYFSTPVVGSWWDRMDASGKFAQGPAPASSFYHIVCALNELISL